MSELKPIDMSVLVGSDVLCEFSDQIDPEIWQGFLHSMYPPEDGKKDPCEFYAREIQETWFVCKPILNHWISNAEGNLVLPDGLMVDFKIVALGRQIEKGWTYQNNIWTKDCPNYSWGFTHENITDDIIAVRITGLAEGYCWSKS